MKVARMLADNPQVKEKLKKAEKEFNSLLKQYERIESRRQGVSALEERRRQ